MKKLKLLVTDRESKGSGHAGRMRKEGMIPAVVYNKERNVPVAVKASDFRMFMREAHGAAVMVEIKGSAADKALCMLHEYQRNPMTDQFEHLDFLEVDAKKPVQTHLNVHVEGEPFGVRNENGLLKVVAHSLEVRCVPKDMPEFVVLDISELKVGESILVSKVKELFPKVEFLANNDVQVVSCVAPKVRGAQQEEEEAAEEGEESAQAGEQKAEA